MNRMCLSAVNSLFTYCLLCLASFPFVNAQTMTFDQIRDSLLSNPPNTGNPTLRENTILALDDILKTNDPSVLHSAEYFYMDMLNNVKTELVEPVTSGLSIWMMYNHGFIIKTPDIVFSFDLVDGYTSWDYELPDEILMAIDIAFISHPHLDHYDYSVVDRIKTFGGDVVVPSTLTTGTVIMAPGDILFLGGLQIKAHYGLHSVTNLIYEVTGPDGLTFLHTGDNQTSTTVPLIDNVDILLLNAWVNESGSASAVTGMRNCINKLTPDVMIPGHIQELYHTYNPGSLASRVPYEWAFAVDDMALPSSVMVMAWGERFFVNRQPDDIGYQDANDLIPAYALYQNTPNPFNPATVIRYQLSAVSEVELIVYDLLGREVQTLVAERQPVGEYTVQWNGSDASGKAVSSGIYLYRLQAGAFVQSRKMLLIR